MKTSWKYNNQATVTGIDDGNCRVKVADIYGGTSLEIDEHGHLISAVPELLEACKKSLNLLCTGYEGGVAKIKISDAGHIISALKNAIEKAEGKNEN